MATAVAKGPEVNPLIKIGGKLPDGDVVMMKMIMKEDGTSALGREVVKVYSVIKATGPTTFVGIPAASTRVCESQLKAYQAKGHEVVVISTDKISSLELWKKAAELSKMTMVSDVHGHIGRAWGTTFMDGTLGLVHLRFTTTVNATGTIVDFEIEKQNADCVKTDVEHTCARLEKVDQKEPEEPRMGIRVPHDYKMCKTAKKDA